MSLRKKANKITNSVGTNPSYSAGQSPRGVASGKGGTSSLKVGNSAGMSESFSRKGDPKGAPANKAGGRA
jgi:hypothetical protein